jgi:hypothetical protein
MAHQVCAHRNIAALAGVPDPYPGSPGDRLAGLLERLALATPVVIGGSAGLMTAARASQASAAVNSRLRCWGSFWAAATFSSAWARHSATENMSLALKTTAATTCKLGNKHVGGCSKQTTKELFIFGTNREGLRPAAVPKLDGASNSVGQCAGTSPGPATSQFVLNLACSSHKSPKRATSGALPARLQTRRSIP